MATVMVVVKMMLMMMLLLQVVAVLMAEAGIRLLHLHHLQALQRLEVIIRGTGGRRPIATGPAVHLFFLFVVLLVVPERRDRIATLACPTTGSPVRHSVLSVARIIPVFVLGRRISRISPPGAQAVGVVLP
ncbi:hypothetical protein PUN28_008492 [Cardiocondyla obscurior]|uniref:Secreted protein n=1 Tax=Cardiocondyla obscurior TaxID=286306 RepID=A0AAW2G0T6_9HYME